MTNKCIYCGTVIPEGRWLCPSCEEYLGVELKVPEGKTIQIGKYQYKEEGDKEN